MSTNQQTNERRLRLSTENWRIIKGLIIGKVKATKVPNASGDRCFKSLTIPMVTIPEYWGLGNNAARQRHVDDDSALLAAIVETLHTDDVCYTTEFSSNLVLDDPTVPGYVAIDPDTPPFCFSPGRGAYDLLEEEFGNSDSTATDDRYNELMAVDITDHRGDLDEFSKTFSLARQAYKASAINDGRSLRDLELTLFNHLNTHFQRSDAAFYDNVSQTLVNDPFFGPSKKVDFQAKIWVAFHVCVTDAEVALLPSRWGVLPHGGARGWGA